MLGIMCIGFFPSRLSLRVEQGEVSHVPKGAGMGTVTRTSKQIYTYKHTIYTIRIRHSIQYDARAVD